MANELIPAMVRVVREAPDLPAVVVVTPSGGPMVRYTLTLTALTALNEDAATALGEAVRRAVSTAARD